jgi:hypothetical protein
MTLIADAAGFLPAVKLKTSEAVLTFQIVRQVN